MPSVSQAQKRLMAAATHDERFAKKAGVDSTVAKEFNQADAKHPRKQLPEKKEGKSTNESLVWKWGRKVSAS